MKESLKRELEWEWEDRSREEEEERKEGGKEAGRERGRKRGKEEKKERERKGKEGKKEAKKLWATILPDLEWFPLTVCIFPIKSFLSGKECTCLLPLFKSNWLLIYFACFVLGFLDSFFK